MTQVDATISPSDYAGTGRPSMMPTGDFQLNNSAAMNSSPSGTWPVFQSPFGNR